MEWIAEKADGVELTLRVVPRASRTEVAGTVGGALKLRLKAPPVDGKANRALIKFLAKRLGTRAANVTLVAGETSRNKRVAVVGVTVSHVTACLGSSA